MNGNQVKRFSVGLLISCLTIGGAWVTLAQTNTNEISTSSTTTTDGVVGDIDTVAIQKQLSAEQDTLLREVLTMIKVETDAANQLIRRITNNQASEAPVVKVNYSDNLDKQSTPPTNTTTLDKTVPWWSKVTNWFGRMAYAIRSWFVPASEAAIGSNCRDGNPELACQQAERLKAGMEKARAKQKELVEKLKQKIIKSQEDNRAAYDALEITETCYDPNRHLLCYKKDTKTGNLFLPDGSKYVPAPLEPEDVINPDSYNSYKYAGKMAGEVDIWFETELIIAQGPTLIDSVLARVAAIACETGIMGDGNYYVKKGKVYFRPNPADNLCSYPLDSGRGKEILRAQQEYNRQMRAYLSRVDESLERLYKRSIQVKPVPATIR